MKQFNISNKGEFIRSLLTTKKFDEWQLVQAKIQKFNTFDIDGQLIEKQGCNTHIKWRDIKDIIFEIIRGKITPKFMKIILKEDYKYTQDSTFAYILSVTYKENLVISSGVTYKAFSMDKESETNWDREVQSILDELKLQYTIIE